MQDPVRSTQPARRTNFDSILNDTSDDESAGAQEEDFQYNQYIDKADEAKIESPGGSNAHDDNASCGKDEGSLASENLEEFSTGGDQHHSEDDSFE